MRLSFGAISSSLNIGHQQLEDSENRTHLRCSDDREKSEFTSKLTSSSRLVRRDTTSAVVKSPRVVERVHSMDVVLPSQPIEEGP